MSNYRPLSVKLKIPTRVQPEVHPPRGQEGLYTNKMHFLNKHLLCKLGSLECAAPFMEPVDSEALNVPTYYTIISNPMDVGTVIQRVNNRYYRSAVEVVRDLKLVVDNCYTFNRPYSQVYRKGVQLEKLVLKVLKKVPVGEEVPYVKRSRVVAETSPTQLECREKLKRLLDNAEEMKQPERDFFHAKWTEVSRELEENRPRSVEEFDGRVLDVLKECRNQAKSIFQHFDSDPDQPLALDDEGKEIPVVSKNVINIFGSGDWPRRQRNIKWQDTVVSALEHTVRCLKKALDNCARDQQAEKPEQPKVDKSGKSGKREVKKKLLKLGKRKRKEQKQLVKMGHKRRKGNKENKESKEIKGQVDEKRKETLTYKLGRILIGAKICNERGKMLRANLVESSDEEEEDSEAEGEGQRNSVSVEERQALQKQFEKLSPETMYEIMHMVEQSENRSGSNVERKYDVMSFSRSTINLLKKAMDADKRPKTKGFKIPAKRGRKPKLDKQPPKLTLKQRRELELKAKELEREKEKEKEREQQQSDAGKRPFLMGLPSYNPKGPAQYFQQ
ncbi:hypothetical protein ACLKA7_006284 [Drosophila subpalustris]